MSLEMETLGAAKSWAKKKIDEAVSGLYRPAGSKTVSELTQSLLIRDNVGNVYNAADSGTTTSDFVEGAGNPINAGDNILVADIGTASNPVYKFDILAGVVDLSDCILKSDTVGLVKNDGTIDTTQYADKTEMSITDGTGTDIGTSTIQLKTGTSKKVLTAHQDVSGKAEKSEMSVTDGTGADADKTTIQLKQGTSATVLKSHQDISGKANRVSGAVTGNFASLDANGNPADSGKKASDFVEVVQGKGLSTNDYTNAEKTKLAGLSNYDDTALSGRVTAIESVVPSAATEQNKLSTAADVAGENISGSATGTAITLTDSTDGMVQGLTIYGRSEVVEGEIKSVGDNGLTVTTANSDNTLTTSAEFTTALPLRGVSDTVRDKQTCTADVKQVETVCGEVDLGDLEWTKRGDNLELYRALLPQLVVDGFALCSDYTYQYKAGANSLSDKCFCTYPNSSNSIFIRDSSYYSSTATDFKAAMSGVKLIYPLATPITTPLTAAEISAFRGLRTFDSTTNINITDEPEFEIDYLRDTENGEAVSRVVDDLQGQINTKYQLSEGEIIAQIADHIYQGTDLTVKFALEIATYNNDPWAWIKARITAGNFTGIHVGDYIPFTTTNNITFNAQIAGINTYKNYGDNAVGAHIDFICKELWPTLHPVNKVNYNNGTAAQNHPWLASDLYLYLNSLAGTVPSAAEVGGGEGTAVDYTEGGVYYYLPTQLKNVIIEKRFLLPTRYSASGLLTDDNSWAWKNIGKLWLPDECEVYGVPVWGGKGGYSIGDSGLQYPLFAGNMNRLKFRNGSRDNWWLLSPSSGNSTLWCYVTGYGHCSDSVASDSNIAAPVCFRIA